MDITHIHVLMDLVEKADLMEVARMWEVAFVAMSIVSLIVFIIIACASKKKELFVLTAIPIVALMILAIIMSNIPTKETCYKEAYLYLINERQNLPIEDFESMKKLIEANLNIKGINND